MLVRTWMSKDPYTIEPSARIKQAADLMQEHNIRHLPVVEKGRLLGIVTVHDVREAGPSPATTFSVGEVHYLLDQILVKDVMTKNPVTVTPDTLVEDAALLAYQRKFGSLPVVEDGRLVGIITQADLFDIMMGIFQGSGEDSRITIEGMPPKLGSVKRIVDTLDAHQVRFTSIVTFPEKQGDLYTYFIRVATTDVEPVVAALKAEGFPVSHAN